MFEIKARKVRAERFLAVAAGGVPTVAEDPAQKAAPRFSLLHFKLPLCSTATLQFKGILTLIDMVSKRFTINPRVTSRCGCDHYARLSGTYGRLVGAPLRCVKRRCAFAPSQCAWSGFRGSSAARSQSLGR